MISTKAKANNNFKVYMHENIVNGKKYIGMTSQDVNKRWKNGKGYINNKHFTDAIIKYGWNNFKHIILCENLDKDKASILEKYYINKYDTTNYKNGYNISLGGDISSFGCKRSRKTKQLLSEKNKGKKRTAKQKENIKTRCRECNGIPVINVVCGKVYNSISQASEETGISKASISNKCKKNSTWKYYNDYHIEKILKEIPDHYLYEHLLNKENVTEEFIIFMGADIEVWRKLTKFRKK